MGNWRKAHLPLCTCVFANGTVDDRAKWGDRAECEAACRTPWRSEVLVEYQGPTLQGALPTLWQVFRSYAKILIQPTDNLNTLCSIGLHVSSGIQLISK